MLLFLPLLLLALIKRTLSAEVEEIPATSCAASKPWFIYESSLAERVLNREHFPVILSYVTHVPSKLLTIIERQRIGLAQLLLLPIKLAHEYSSDLLRDMPLCDSLFELFDYREIMKGRLQDLFEDDTGKCPQTKTTVKFVVEKLFSEAAMIHTHILFKSRHFSSMMDQSSCSDKLDMLALLVKLAPNDKLFDFTHFRQRPNLVQLAYNLARTEFKGALRLLNSVTIRDNVELFAGILLAPLSNEEFAQLETSLRESMSEPEFDVLVYRAVSAAISATDIDNFSKVIASRYNALMSLLNQVSIAAPNACDMIHFIYILCSIEAGMTCEELMTDIAGFMEQSLPNIPGQSHAGLLVKLFSSATRTNNHQLTKYLLAHPVANGNDVIQQWELEQIGIFVVTSEALEQLQGYSTEGGYILDSDWMNGLGDTARLAVLAKMGNIVEFDALAHQSRHSISNTALEMISCILLGQLDNPVPFASILLYLSGPDSLIDINREEYAVKLLQYSGDVDMLSVVLSHVPTISLDWSFYQKLPNSALAQSFKSQGGKMVRDKLCFGYSHMLKLLRLRDWEIDQLFDIFGLPVAVNEAAFSPHIDERLEEKLERFKRASTLRDFDALAQEPGFLSYIALAIGRERYQAIIRDLAPAFNPAINHVFELLFLWFKCNKRSFVQVADWYTVTSFFAVKPVDPRAFIGSVKIIAYPASLQSVIEAHAHGDIYLVSFTEAGNELFSTHVWPEIAELCKSVNCRLHLDGKDLTF